jgi:hypothetical protein
VSYYSNEETPCTTNPWGVQTAGEYDCPTLVETKRIEQ